MATPGARVITSNGKQGILSTGSPSIFNASGECSECCGDACLDDIAIALAVLTDGVSFSITADGSCYYENLTLTLVSSDTEQAYFEGIQAGDTVYLDVEPVCDLTAGSYNGTIYLLFSLNNDVGAPIFIGSSNAIAVDGSTVITDWSWPTDLETDPFYGCATIPVTGS